MTAAVEPTFGDIRAELARDRRISHRAIAARLGMHPNRFSDRLNSEEWSRGPTEKFFAEVMQAIEEEKRSLDAGGQG